MHSTRSEYKVMMMTIIIGIIADYTATNRPLHTIKQYGITLATNQEEQR